MCKIFSGVDTVSEVINVNFLPKINYACYQNDIAILKEHYNPVISQQSLLKELKIINNSDSIWNDIKVVMDSTLNFITPKTWQISTINPSEEIFIKDRKIELNANFLRNQEESASCIVTFSIFTGETLIEKIKF